MGEREGGEGGGGWRRRALEGRRVLCLWKRRREESKPEFSLRSTVSPYLTGAMGVVLWESTCSTCTGLISALQNEIKKVTPLAGHGGVHL